MSSFDYVIVLISIILGLGITTILTGIAELIKQSRLFTLYAPYIIWIVLVFVLHINDWWESYDFKAIKGWSFGLFLFILLYPINLYILAHLLFPYSYSRDFNSRDFYLKNFPRLFISVIILDIQSIIQNVALTHHPLETQVPHVILLAILSMMIIFKTRNEVVHIALSILLLLMLTVSLAIEHKVIY